MADSIEKNVFDIISSHSEVARDKLTLDSKLEDVGLDSMGVAETLFDLEDFYGVAIPDSDDIQERFNLGTIGDLVSVLEKLTSEKETAA